MPLYEYYCRSCSTKFEKLVPLRQATAAVACPAGHQEAERTLSVFAVVRAGDGAMDFAPAAGGGCCGGGACACGGGSMN